MFNQDEHAEARWQIDAPGKYFWRGKPLHVRRPAVKVHFWVYEGEEEVELPRAEGEDCRRNDEADHHDELEHGVPVADAGPHLGQGPAAAAAEVERLGPHLDGVVDLSAEG